MHLENQIIQNFSSCTFLSWRDKHILYYFSFHIGCIKHFVTMFACKYHKTITHYFLWLHIMMHNLIFFNNHTRKRRIRTHIHPRFYMSIYKHKNLHTHDSIHSMFHRVFWKSVNQTIPYYFKSDVLILEAPLHLSCTQDLYIGYLDNLFPERSTK